MVQTARLKGFALFSRTIIVHLVLPYAMSDYATSFATIPINELLSSMD